jgi:hypothetical protein
MSDAPIVKKPRKLSLKQKRFIAEYLKDGNGTKAALVAYDTKDYFTANAIAVENLQKPSIENAIAEALPDELLKERHLELLNKREVVSYKKDDGTYEREMIDQPDTMAVSKGLDMAYKIKGSYAPEKQIIAHAFVLPDEEKSRIDNILNDNA